MKSVGHCLHCGEFLETRWLHCPWCGEEKGDGQSCEFPVREYERPGSDGAGNQKRLLEDISCRLDHLERELSEFLSKRR